MRLFFYCGGQKNATRKTNQNYRWNMKETLRLLRNGKSFKVFIWLAWVVICGLGISVFIFGKEFNLMLLLGIMIVPLAFIFYAHFNKSQGDSK